jgi:tRNA 2-thiouridine synthesizing protein B
VKLLHTVNHPALLQTSLRATQPGDSLLLLENGVYCATGNGVETVDPDISILALHEDLAARGLITRIDSRIRIVDTRAFVQLCCEHERLINWF